jgi:glutamate-1-semialdehyde 2,1-aminomutase
MADVIAEAEAEAGPVAAPRPPESLAGIDRDRLRHFATREAQRYSATRPKTQHALKVGGNDWLSRVPMHWMRDWPMPFPIVVEKAKGAKLTDIDGITLDDFCLGDTGSLFGHSPKAVSRAVRAQVKRGLTYMLPTEAALEAGQLLSKRFWPLQWQVAMTATDANRFAIRVARAITGRPKILVFDGAYHGTVDDVMVELAEGESRNRAGLVGQVADLTVGAVAVPFNDIDAVKAALASGEVAAVLTEPVMTNCCMVLPEPGFLEALRDLCSTNGTLLIIDETHTLSSGLGGYAKGHDLMPDILVLGKAVAGGVPCAVWGLSDAVAMRYLAYDKSRASGHSGMGTTLSGNPVQFAALRATLADVMTPQAYDHMEAGAERLERGLAEAIARFGAPWHVVRVGARVEFICSPTPLKTGGEAKAAHCAPVERALHMALVNRGCLIAPFHNMMLVSPATKKKQIDRLVGAFADCLEELFA